MSHPPQEGSSRSLAYCTLLGVLWQMYHAWITYGNGQKDCSDIRQIRWHMWEIPRNVTISKLLGPLWQSCHAWVTYSSACSVVVATTDQVTCGTISHVRLGHVQQRDMHNKCTDMQNTHNECMNC